MRSPRRLAVAVVLWALSASVAPQSLAAVLPSLFRGVVVADSPLGVRVVSVEEISQAFLGDLRPEDIIVRMGAREVHSIDEFATLSQQLKGRVTRTTILVFRNGIPKELTLHLYSYPLLRRWGVKFLPDHDVRFAEARVRLDYWRRLGRAFEEAGKPLEALNAYLNGLHLLPDDVPTALQVTLLSLRMSRRHLEQGQLPEGLALLQQAVTVMERLFDEPLTDEALQLLKRELAATLRTLRSRGTA